MSLVGIGTATSPAQAKGSEESLRQAARQLEGIFVNLMFEEMAKTVGESELFPQAPGSKMYEQWFRGAVAEQWTASGGTGLGDRIAASLKGTAKPEDLRSALGEVSGNAEARLEAPTGPGRDLHPPSGAARPLGERPRWPVAGGQVSSGFGHRTHPVHGGSDDHRGIDLAVPEGTSVRVPFAGRVAEVGENAALGRYVIVEHQGGYRSLFGHLSDVGVRKGAAVRAGDIVAASGNSGRTTGPHLHYGLYRDGRAVDPTPFLD